MKKVNYVFGGVVETLIGHSVILQLSSTWVWCKFRKDVTDKAIARRLKKTQLQPE